MMGTEGVILQLAANMSAAFKKVWKIIGATNLGDCANIRGRWKMKLAKTAV
jgi:hypothetical protein